MASNNIKTYKIILAYDGTAYHGWQTQNNCRSIAGTLHHTFQQTFKRPAHIVGASRTDAGVHALGQTMRLTTDLSLDAHTLRYAWQNLLPKDIVIRSLEEIDPSFHPQRKVKTKIYHYHFCTERPLPFISRYVWFYRPLLDIQKLETCLQQFIGTHDFRSFCTGYERENTVRTIDTIRIEYLKQYNIYRIVVVGESFLRYMIRRMVGASLLLASDPNRPAATITQALQEKNPRQELLTAPPEGLILRKIIYE